MRAVIGILATVLLAMFALQSAALMEWIGWRGFGKAETLRLGAYEGDVGALEWIAKDQGFFDQSGLNVELTGYASGKEATEALRAGSVDIATAADFVTVSRSFNEPDLRILGNISYYRNKAVVARRDAGIATAGDLRGKRIGVTVPSSAEYSLYVFLALNGLTLQDVNVVSLPPKQIVAAMADGGIDAALTWAPHIQDIQDKLGAGGITFEGDGFDAYLLLLARKDVAETRGAALKKLLRGLVLAEDWVKQHPEEAKQYLAERFKLTPAYIDWLWPRMQLDLNLPQELLAVMDGQARWLAKKDGLASAIPNYGVFVRPDELKAVKASAVTLYTDSRRPAAVGTAAGAASAK